MGAANKIRAEDLLKLIQLELGLTSEAQNLFMLRTLLWQGMQDLDAPFVYETHEAAFKIDSCLFDKPDDLIKTIRIQIEDHKGHCYDPVWRTTTSANGPGSKRRRESVCDYNYEVGDFVCPQTQNAYYIVEHPTHYEVSSNANGYTLRLTYKRLSLGEDGVMPDVDFLAQTALKLYVAKEIKTSQAFNAMISPTEINYWNSAYQQAKRTYRYKTRMNNLTDDRVAQIMARFRNGYDTVTDKWAAEMLNDNRRAGF